MEYDYIALESVSLHRMQSGQAHELSALMARIYPPIYRHLWEDEGQWYLSTVYGPEQVEKDLKDQRIPWWLVKQGEETIGMLRLLPDKVCADCPEKEAMLLQRIYLDPIVIGQGIGRQVMNFAADFAQSLDKEVLWLEVMDTQDSAIGFYKRMGFEIGGTFRLTFEKMLPPMRGMYRMLKYL